MQAWEDFLAAQEEELGAGTVRKWLRPLKVAHFDACNLYLQASDSFQILWFEEHIRQKVNIMLLNNNNRRIKVHLSLDNPVDNDFKKTASKSNRPEKVKSSSPLLFTISFDELDPYCTFDHFLRPANHLLPYKLLCRLVGYNEETQILTPNKTELASFNPIYLYGPSGTGKTHLLMSTAHALRQQGLSVAYVRAETFTEHVVTAIRAGEMSRFRQTYRNTDILIIDDVNIFAKKWATQEELFHTFNTLHLAGKQIILSANCSPAELMSLEPRLISRFEWGIVLPLMALQKQEMETALLTKAKALHFPLNPKATAYLLETFSNNMKVLCRALEALMLRSHLHQKDANLSSTQLTVPYIQHHLADLIQEAQQNVLNPAKIIQHTAEFFGIRPEDILGKSQNRDCVLPRQISMFFCRTELQLPFTKIALLFSKDHSTVMSSVKLIQKGIEEDNQNICVPYQALLKKIQ